jgi:flagellar biosynthesis protein FlhF
MQIKRFEAGDMQEALKQVKEAMGPDAMILSTKTFKSPSGRQGASKRKIVEVVAAVDRHHPSLPGRFTPDPVPGRPSPEVLNGPPRQDEAPLLQGLLSTGLTPEFVHRLMKEMPSLEGDTGGSSISETLRKYLQWKLMEVVQVTGPTMDGMKMWALIGPTGVGKTTTLAKLAALYRLKAHKKITLITVDTYRIGAVDQLKTYAAILQLPLEVAYQPEDLRRIIENNKHQDLLLIDTVGRSPNDSRHLEELRDFLAVHPQLQTHLLLSATTKEQDLAKIVQQFSFHPIASYIFTKLDETEAYAPIFNQLLRDRKPLSYLTNGQKVPEDIELATKVRVANLVLDSLQWN